MNLVVVAGAVAVFVWVVSGLVVGGGPASTAALPTATTSPAPAPDVTPSVSPDVSRGQEMRGYALSLPEVEGLPSDLQPGDRLEIWVAWDPPLTKEPSFRTLVRGARYERTIPPVVVGEPPAAVILVPEDKIDELMYGDRYGSLSVSLIER